jgi:signal transduction histidine kinase
LKHARSQDVRDSPMQEATTLCLEVEDDGTGFSRDAVPGGGLGMTTMRERAQVHDWLFNVSSNPGKSTRVQAKAEVNP